MKAFVESGTLTVTAGPPPANPQTTTTTGPTTLYTEDDTIAVHAVQPQPPQPLPAPAIVSVPVNWSRLTCLDVQYSGSRYERFTRHFILRTSVLHELFKKTDLAAGGATNVSFEFPRYTLLVNGVERAWYTRIASERQGFLDGSLADEPDGLTRFDVVGLDAAANVRVLLIPFWGYINRTGHAKDDPRAVVQNGSHQWYKGADYTYQFAIVDKALLDTSRVRPKRADIVPVPFTHEAKNTDLTLITYITRGDDVSTTVPYVTSEDITTTAAMQDYFFRDMTGVGGGADPQQNQRPRLRQLDGPYGTASGAMICDVQFTSAVDPATGKPFVMKFTFSTPYAACALFADGTKMTLNGIRHIKAPLWSEEQLDKGRPDLYAERFDHIEYMGEWDASVPQHERFPAESWGSWTDPRTTVNDFSVPPIGGLAPHKYNPTKFRSDRHGFILKEVYAKDVHGTPPVITRWAETKDAWGMGGRGTTLYTCERQDDCISLRNIDTGAYLGKLVEGPHDLGALDAARVWRGASVSTTRQFDCVAPEGLRIALVNGKWYAYWASLAQRDVRRIQINANGTPIPGAPVEIVCHPKLDNNSNYIYVAVSEDGRNFGPSGTVAVASWTVLNNGRPQLFVPSPGPAADDGTPVLNSRAWVYQKYAAYVSQGPGGAWDSASYTAACDIGPGVLACGSADNGLDVFVLYDAARDGVKPTAADYTRLKTGGEYYKKHFAVLHGTYCNGPNIPLPWGTNADCDFFMRWCGYTPETEGSSMLAALTTTPVLRP